MSNQIEESLKSKNIDYIPQGHDLLVKCLNPEHEDSKPSMRIDNTTGVFHCLSCGYKGNIFQTLNIDNNKLNSRVIKLQQTIGNIKRETYGLDIPVGAIPFEQEYRGIKVETYIKFSAFECQKNYAGRLVFPITDAGGRITCFNSRAKDLGVEPKYSFYPQKVVPKPFPATVVLQDNSIIVVEGLFDMLNMHDKGAEHTVCVFGTRKVTEDNVLDYLLPYMIMGCTKITIMFDGDKAGRTAAYKLKTIIEMKTDIEATVYDLPDGYDPGGLDQEEVDSVLRDIKT